MDETDAGPAMDAATTAEAAEAMTSDGAFGAFFSLAPYHLLLSVLGLIILAAHWLPRLVSHRDPAAAPLMVVFGAVAGLMPFLPTVPTPLDAPLLWERVSELCVIVALFATGLRVDSLRDWVRWRPTVRLLVVAMPLTILALTVAGIAFAGLTLGAAVLLGAVMAPTDPVLAGDVQVGPPQEGAEHPVRFALTTEAALNDGLAFPFVYFALALIAAGGWGAWIGEWALIDVGWRIVVGTVMGAGGGWILAHLLFTWPRGRSLAETDSGIVALAGVFLCYGTTELVEGYGFIAVAVMGLVLRRVEIDHKFHRRLHDFTSAIEHALTALLLVALGAVLPRILDVTSGQVAVTLLLLFVIRPLGGWLALPGCGLGRRGRWLAAFYGVRGIGSIYYLSYAATHAEIEGIEVLWSLLALIVLVSSLVHGLSAGRAMSRHRDTDADLI